MELKNKNRFYKIFWMWNILRNGLFLHGLRNRLARIGLDFMPYYWVQEGVGEFEAPKIRGEALGYSISYFGEEELIQIKSSISGIAHKNLLKYLDEGQTCVGLKHDEHIAAYMFIKQKDYFFRGKTFNFKDNEAYMHSMYTFESYRGKNLAPYLRYHCYRLAKEQGVDTTYSISEYFNKSTIKFKNKLNSKHLYLYLSIVLFKRYNWNFTIRKYNIKKALSNK